MKKNIILAVCLGIIGVLGKIILQDNFIYFVKMWLAVLVIGIAFFPFCYQIFKKFKLNIVLILVLFLIVKYGIKWYNFCRLEVKVCKEKMLTLIK